MMHNAMTPTTAPMIIDLGELEISPATLEVGEEGEVELDAVIIDTVEVNIGGVEPDSVVAAGVEAD